MDTTNAISFTGHRVISNVSEIKESLIKTLEPLILFGATYFYTGGATGFDTLAANVIIALRKKYPQLKLHLILPCCAAEQTLKWNAEKISEYNRIFKVADSADFVCEHYTFDCMKKRNAELIKLSDCCICYYNQNKPYSGTGQTVRMAQRKGITILNLF